MKSHNIILFVVEGPAGSGKSTLIRNLGDIWKPVPRLGELPRPRSYTGEEGIRLSQAKDALSAIAIAYEEPNTPLVVDRWFISQWVYGSIRSDQEPNAMQGMSLIRHGVERIIAEVEERGLRTLKTNEVLVTISLNFIILLPSEAVLQNNRKLGGKEYPFDPHQELAMYRKVFTDLTFFGLPVSAFEMGSVADQAVVHHKVRTEVYKMIMGDWK